jgi:hypothetical protein
MSSTSLFAALVAVIAPATLLAYGVGCSSSTTGAGGGGTTDDGGKEADSINSGSDAAPEAAGGGDAGTEGGTDPDQGCYSLADGGCYDCCDQHHMTGSTTYYDALFTCVCTAANCQTQCAQTDCSMADDAGSSMTGDPCDLCEQQYAPDDGGGACGTPIATACNADPDCTAWLNCGNNCP